MASISATGSVTVWASTCTRRPRLSRIESEQPLQAGNVVTVEPGVYLPGRLGVRIEDLLVVREHGHEILTGLSKDFTVI